MAITNALIAAENYRDFLAIAIEQSTTLRSGRVNYSSFARKAGFSSRSFAKDVVLGKRRITAASLQRFISALKLSGSLRTYFETLVSIEEQDVRPSSLTREQRVAKLHQLRNRLKQIPVNEESAARLFKKQFLWLDVYASLGDSSGASLEAISRRVNLAQGVCKNILNEMLAEKIVTYEDKSKQYLASQRFLSMENLGSSHFVQKYFEHGLKEASQWSRTDFHSSEKLFAHAVFSMDSKKAVVFKKKLRKLIVEFSENIENPRGDCLGRIVVAFGKVE